VRVSPSSVTRKAAMLMLPALTAYT
jgi:hypothetical protein